jgi:uncharacterized protein (DUF1778 family)
MVQVFTLLNEIKELEDYLGRKLTFEEYLVIKDRNKPMPTVAYTMDAVAGKPRPMNYLTPPSKDEWNSRLLSPSDDEANDYLVDLVFKENEELMDDLDKQGDHSTVTLSDRDYQAVLEQINNPPPANQKLKDACQERKNSNPDTNK